MSAVKTLADLAATNGLQILGVAPTSISDGLDPSLHSIVLLGPDEPRFWSLFQGSPEASDDQPDPIDRWSTRVIGGLATEVDGTALFPFGGPPYLPFLTWATRTGRVWASPVGLFVHETCGLFVSFRGAIGLKSAAPGASEATSPCESCDEKPCLTACPVNAFADHSYDVPACKSWLKTGAGAACRGGGCLVRRACPVGAGKRLAAQSAFHMEAFAPA